MSPSPNPNPNPNLVLATERQHAKGTITPKETDDADTLPKPTRRELENHQLALFQTVLCNTDEERDRLSHAIELWDSTPRYSLNRKAMNKARVNGQFLEPQELSFHYRGGKYTLTVSPARLKDADGVFRDYFPGATEELVEECLRKLAIVFHGRRGELRQHYREGQEDQLGALGLVVNIMVLWNTIYMNAALEQLRREGFPVNPEDVAKLSPLIYDHINFLGRYAFALPDLVASGQLRPLRQEGSSQDDA